MTLLNQIKRLYSLKNAQIRSRLKEFEQLWSHGNDEVIFAELAFCILTPQSKAKVCWDAIERLKKKGLLLKGDVRQIKKELIGVRFKNKKAGYIVEARKLFMTQNRIKVIPPRPPLVKGGWGGFLSKFADVRECREWLVKNIKGLGYKEASHFLRNIGLGENIAILDRHILKNLKQLGIIQEIPKSISKAKYMQIEKDMMKFARQINIPLSHLDLLLWCKETGEIFK